MQATLRHPNVVSVIDVVEIGTQSALVMEYVDGTTLEDLLVRDPPSPALALELGRGIVAGVAAAHRAGFVHRDLKPANVLLARCDGGWLPKVTDFGLAKLLDTDDGIQSTRSGMVMGTPCYMSPEQIRSPNAVDHRADVFSLGCILYELATGTVAFPGDDVLEIFTRIAAGRYVPPLERVPDLHPGFAAAIEGALRTDRGERTPDCDALLAALPEPREVSGGPPVPRRTTEPPAASTILPEEPTRDTEEPHPETLWTQDRPVAASVPPTSSGASWPPEPLDSSIAPTTSPGMRSSIVALGAGAGVVATLGALGVAAIAVVAIGLAWFGMGDGAEPPVDLPEPDVVDVPEDTPTPDPAPEPPPEHAPRQSPDAPVEPTPRSGAPPPAPASLEMCGDPAALGASAASGALTAESRRCLSEAMRRTDLAQVDRGRLGRIVLNDAGIRCERGACADYEREQRYFFEEIDRSDAEMLFEWTSWLSEQSAADIGRLPEVRTWAARALERKQAWKEGITYVQRVAALLAIDARAAGAMREVAPEDGRLRLAARNAAIEWLNYRVQLGRDQTEAFALCVAAADDEAACRQRKHEDDAIATITIVTIPMGGTVTHC